MEIWKDIPGYNNLQASNLGNVRTTDKWVNAVSNSKRKMKGRILSKRLTKKGYEFIRVSIDNVPKSINIHKLVALAFHENPENKKTVNHKDGNKTNNFASNLEWMTHSENLQHAYDNNLCEGLKGAKNPTSKLDKNKVLWIRDMVRMGAMQKVLAEILGVNRITVSRIVNNQSWLHI